MVRKKKMMTTNLAKYRLHVRLDMHSRSALMQVLFYQLDGLDFQRGIASGLNCYLSILVEIPNTEKGLGLCPWQCP